MVRGNFTVVGIGIGLGNYGEYPNTYTAPKNLYLCIKTEPVMGG